MRFLGIVLVVVMGVVNVYAEWYKPEWKCRKSLALDGNIIQSELKDFPVCVQVPASETDFYDSVKADGSDIVFTSADGKTELPHEIELLDQAKKQFVCWVKLPELKPGKPTNFYIYYGNKAAVKNAKLKKQVWTNDYIAVWHMNSDKSGKDAPDSLGQFNLKADGKTKFTEGKVGIAGETEKDPKANFSYNYYRGATAPQLKENESFTISTWVFIKSKNDYNNLFYDWPLRLFYHGSGRWQINVLKQKSIAGASYVMDKSPLNKWVCIDAVYNSENKTLNMYINGKAGKDICPDVVHAGLREKSALSILSGFAGMQDEVRFSRTARSAAWIKASYENQNNSSLISCGKMETDQ